MKIKSELLILGMILIILSVTLISAENFTENNSIENQSIEETLLINLDNITLNEKTENDDGGAPSPSSHIQFINETNSSKEEPPKEKVSTSHSTIIEKGDSSPNEKTKNNDEEASTSSSPSPKEKTVSITLYDEGKKEIEGKIPESFTAEIKKTETRLDDKTKKVIVKSSEHLEAPLTVYADIEETLNEKDIIVYWENEGEKINIKEFLDEDNDGMIDRISWIVPHLSEQIFKITVTPKTSENSSEVSILVSGLSGTKINPISFDLDVDYSPISNLVCQISIDGNAPDTINLNTNTIFNENLSNGDHDWEIYCEDNTNSSINNLENGTFTINENAFEITGINEGENFLDNSEISYGVSTPQDVGPLLGVLNLFSPSGASPTIPYSLGKIIPGMISGEAGTYILQAAHDYFENVSYINKSFYVAHASITPDSQNVLEGDTVTFTIEFDSPSKSINTLLIDMDDGSNEIDDHLNPPQVGSFTVDHTFSSSGNYKPEMSFFLGGTDPFTVESPTIIVTDPSTTNTAPEIDLIYPKEDELVKEDRITFRYKPADDKKINWCTYELFIATGDGTSELDYTTTDSTIVNGEEVEVRLTAFDDGDYTWYVYCEDNESKSSEDEIGHFTVQTSSHENAGKIEDALDNLNSFKQKMEDFTLEQKEAIEEIGMDEDLAYYSKRLIQIDQDLGNNFKFISDETLKEKRIEESINELNEIIDKIPVDVKITDSTEYIKNSLTADLMKITEEYTDGKNIQLTYKEIKKLAEQNIPIQDEISVSANIKQIEIEYASKKEKITSVKKKITLGNGGYDTILEQLPSTFENIVFKTKSTELNPSLFEINVEYLENNELSYLIKEDVETNKLKETETILFEETAMPKKGITGNFSLETNGGINWKLSIILTVFLSLVAYFGRDIYDMMRMNFWKRETNVRRILEYSEKAKKSLKSEDKEIAKEYYHKIKEIYPLVPEGFKKKSYPTIKKIRIGIDKRDMMDFVKEYEIARKEGREEDTKRIYKNIQDQYKKLPEKYQQKVYDRVIKEQVGERFNL